MIPYQSLRLVGPPIETVLKELSELRVQTFYDFPYLYEGHLEYEKNYLNRYLKSPRSFFFGLWDQNQLIGATTGLPLIDEDPSFHNSIVDVQSVYYFGESLLLPKYRGQKIGHLFFDEREAFAVKNNNFKITCFCSVIRPADHPLRPLNYRPHDLFWQKRGYQKQNQWLTQMSWQDRNEKSETFKTLQFWMKDWTSNDI